MDPLRVALHTDTTRRGSHDGQHHQRRWIVERIKHHTEASTLSAYSLTD